MFVEFSSTFSAYNSVNDQKLGSEKQAFRKHSFNVNRFLFEPIRIQSDSFSMENCGSLRGGYLVVLAAGTSWALHGVILSI